MNKVNAPADALDPFTERRACAVVRLLLERDGIERRLLEVRLDQHERVLGHHHLVERREEREQRRGHDRHQRFDNGPDDDRERR